MGMEPRSILRAAASDSCRSPHPNVELQRLRITEQTPALQDKNSCRGVPLRASWPGSRPFARVPIHAWPRKKFGCVLGRLSKARGADRSNWQLAQPDPPVSPERTSERKLPQFYIFHDVRPD